MLLIEMKTIIHENISIMIIFIAMIEIIAVVKGNIANAMDDNIL